MVSLIPNYEKQRYVLNSNDDPGDIEFHNGDILYLMDVRQEIIYSEEDNQWYPVPTGGGGGGTSAIIGESTAADQSMVIPKADGYNNFYAYPKDGDAAYFNVSGRPICCFRLSWMGTSVYSMKSGNTNQPPTSATGTFHPTGYITETASSISVKFNNVNTMGDLPNGTTIAYILW